MKPRTFGQKLSDEIQQIGLTTAYFAAWLGLLVTIKVLVLEEYHIRFRGISAVVLGAFILAKVVLVLEHVPLGKWIERCPAIADVISRSILYAFGVFIVLLLEKAVEARHEYGGFGTALTHVFQHPDMPHVWANIVCVACALVGFNFLSVLRRHLGDRWIPRILLRPLPTTHK